MLSAEVLFCFVATHHPPHMHLPDIQSPTRTLLDGKSCSMYVKFLTERHNIVASQSL